MTYIDTISQTRLTRLKWREKEHKYRYASEHINRVCQTSGHLKLHLKNNGKIRIIAGKWRSRHIRFEGGPGLRPSPDAVRETLFNWIQMKIKGSHCLDLFAGSGALGFEAASRGAKQVTLVESNRRTFSTLRQSSELLEAQDDVDLFNMKAAAFIEQCTQQFDIIFVDPPFDTTLASSICEQIDQSNMTTKDAIIYLETKKSSDPLPIPSTWHIIRQKHCGMVNSTLIQL